MGKIEKERLVIKNRCDRNKAPSFRGRMTNGPTYTIHHPKYRYDPCLQCSPAGLSGSFSVPKQKSVLDIIEYTGGGLFIVCSQEQLHAIICKIRSAATPFGVLPLGWVEWNWVGVGRTDWFSLDGPAGLGGWVLVGSQDSFWLVGFDWFA